MTGVVAPPFSEEAERSVVGQMLAKPDCIGEVTSTLLESEHFYVGGFRTLYAALVEAFFADDPIDPLTIGEVCSKRLASAWAISEQDAVQRVITLGTRSMFAGDPVDHAKVIKRHADLRALLNVAESIVEEVKLERLSPDEIAGLVGSEATKIATNSVVKHEIVQFGDAGRKFIGEMKRRMALKQAGIEVGVKFGVGAVDAFTMGVQPSELLVAGGESGVGKSGVWWRFGMNFAEVQAQLPRQPQERPVGTLIFSLEMGDLPSSTRFAQGLTHIDGAHMREGSITQQELGKIVQEWGSKKDYPLWLNYASGLRLSELRALVAEAIRKHNVGLVIIDHFLLLHPDRPMDSNEADNARVEFLKNQIAKDMNVAVICLAHTRKAIERADKRPRLSDLRGSGMIAAFADFVPLMFRPWQYASDKDKDSGKVQPTDAEFIWAKNRHGLDGIGNFYFDPSRQLAV